MVDSVWNTLTRKKWLLIALVGIIALVLVVLFVVMINRPATGSHRVESYKDVSGVAGLNAVINYNCADVCNQKFDFNVYIFTKDGQQVSVVRPDKSGRVNIALPEGNYVMLVGKQLGEDGVFPQEFIALKNGKELGLKLDYKGGK